MKECFQNVYSFEKFQVFCAVKRILLAAYDGEI